MTSTVHAPRDRSAAVKADIRASASRLFTTGGFEATGIRDIAADADVNPAIVIRHFGSKEQLFLETVDTTTAWKGLLDGPIDDLGERIVRGVTRGRKAGLRIFGTIVRASAKPDIRAQLQASMSKSIADVIAPRLDAPDAELRAHLFAAQLAGLMMALTVYDDVFLLETPVEDIVSRYGPALQHTLTGP